MLAAGAGLMAVDRALETGQKAFMLVQAARATTPAAAGGWASVCSTTSRWRPPTPSRSGGSSGCSSSTGTSTTATVPRPCSTSEPRVLFFSTHEAGHYPGTGMAREVGSGDGSRVSRSTCPCRPGEGDGAVLQAFESLLAPLARAFKPQLLLVSAGYDPQSGDPLGDLRFSQTSFQWMAARLVADGRGDWARRVRCASWREATSPR